MQPFMYVRTTVGYVCGLQRRAFPNTVKWELCFVVSKNSAWSQRESVPRIQLLLGSRNVSL
jgi:hypothetical protein